MSRKVLEKTSPPGGLSKSYLYHMKTGTFSKIIYQKGLVFEIKMTF